MKWPGRRDTRVEQRRESRAGLRGEFAITEAAIEAAERLLPTYRSRDGDHEGMLFLLGYEIPDTTVFTSVLAPDADHGPGHVVCEPEAIAAAASATHRCGLALLGQLHSHPRVGTRHSLGDDELVLMPFEGMLSIVAPWYGRFGMRPLSGLGVHQYQDGNWVAIADDSVSRAFTVIPTEIDLR